MAQVIWKYVLPFETEFGPFDVEMPRGARPFTAQMQHERICVWALVDDEETATETHRFWAYGTGHQGINASTERHLGSVQLADGTFVFHVFEEAL